MLRSTPLLAVLGFLLRLGESEATSLICTLCLGSCHTKFDPLVTDAECIEHCISVGLCVEPPRDPHVPTTPSPVPLTPTDISEDNMNLFRASSKTALVLSGGGSWGAMEVGFLRALCESKVVDELGGFDMLVGTSIGAYNTAMLAQFDKDQLCTQGVNELEAFWLGIQKSTEVLTSMTFLRLPCLAYTDSAYMAWSFFNKAGVCDSSRGNSRVMKAIDLEKVRSSNVRAFVDAVNLNTSSVTWFDDQDPLFMHGVIASGSITPLVPPYEINGELYMDGGLIHNTPILKALHAGATHVVALLLTSIIEPVRAQAPLGGLNVLSFIKDRVLQQQLLHEVQLSCALYPNARIWALFPMSVPAHSFISFSPAALSDMIELGYNDATRFVRENQGLVDLCPMLRIEYLPNVNITNLILDGDGTTGADRDQKTREQTNEDAVSSSVLWVIIGVLFVLVVALAIQNVLFRARIRIIEQPLGSYVQLGE